MIPSTWRRYQLSQLINKALSLPRVIPFDFLIGGEVLKGSLEERAAGEVCPKDILPTLFINRRLIIIVRLSLSIGGNIRDRIHRKCYAPEADGKSAS